MKNLDASMLRRFLRLAGEQLKGKWLLVGGTLLPALGIEVRSTIDIDFLGLGKEEAAQNLELMDVANSLGLPIESINQAGLFFLKQVGYQPKDLILLHQGQQGQIFRPSFALYLKLKLGRLSETDASDCVHYFRFCRDAKDDLDIPELSKILSSAKRSLAPYKRERLRDLQRELSQIENALS